MMSPIGRELPDTVGGMLSDLSADVPDAVVRRLRELALESKDLGFLRAWTGALVATLNDATRRLSREIRDDAERDVFRLSHETEDAIRALLAEPADGTVRGDLPPRAAEQLADTLRLASATLQRSGVASADADRAVRLRAADGYARRAPEAETTLLNLLNEKWTELQATYYQAEKGPSDISAQYLPRGAKHHGRGRSNKRNS